MRMQMKSDVDIDPIDLGKAQVSVQLSESVAMHLRERIISGKLRKGEFLRIDAVAKALNISTTPVREGLLLLQSESFVRLMPRRGFVVNSFSKSDLVDLFWAQATVGAELAARAATRMSKADFNQLQDLHARHKKAAAENDYALAARLGHQFHRTINLAAQSPRLALLMGSLARQLPNRFYTSVEGQLNGALQYHPIIIDAIRVKDADSVRSLMHRHIISGAEYLAAMLERQGVWGTDAADRPAKAVRAKGKPRKKGRSPRRR
jgi:DNA-binding GntR family transcriptional regulator